jgi:chemotaxis protein methyltransferase CheR
MALSQDILLFFAKFIEKELGIIYVEANYFQLEHRLRDISTQLGFASIDELYQKARTGISGSMKSLLLDLATNNETSFFRDISIFRALSSHIIPELLKDPYKSVITIWSAASSSGQEIYSIAMEIEELRKTALKVPMVRYMASDVSDTILKRARNGLYSQIEIQRGLPAKLMIEYFTKTPEDQWLVKSHLQSMMNFKKINLLEDWGDIGKFDIIFIRNVLIYQNVENKKKVIEGIYARLNPKGFLILGAAESLYGVSERFKQVAVDKAIIYQRD